MNMTKENSYCCAGCFVFALQLYTLCDVLYIKYKQQNRNRAKNKAKNQRAGKNRVPASDHATTQHTQTTAKKHQGHPKKTPEFHRFFH